MKRYAIWNKTDSIITPVGEVLTAEQWIARHPVARLESITVVCAAGEVNGAFFGTLGQMVQLYSSQGCDFTGCETAEEKLDAIEAFDDKKRQIIAATSSPEERQATALEAIASGATSETKDIINALIGEE